MTPLRSSLAVLVAFLVASVGAHTFNHQDRHEICEIYISPSGHHDGDGHAHWHHNTAVGAHEHDGVMYDETHTHSNVRHDPCNQIGMVRTMFTDASPIPEIPLAEAVIGDGTVPATIIEEEAYNLGALRKQTSITVRGDNALAAMGFPGSGTTSDPYIIENFLITNNLVISDTNACIIVRNNVIHSQGIVGPLVDPSEITDVGALVTAAEEALTRAEGYLAQAEADLAELLPGLEAMNAQHSEWQTILEQAEARSAQAREDQNAAQQAYNAAQYEFNRYLADYDNLVAQYQEALAEASEPAPEPKADPVGFGDHLGAFQAYVASVEVPEDNQAELDALAADIAALASEYSSFQVRLMDLDLGLAAANQERADAENAEAQLRAQFEQFLAVFSAKQSQANAAQDAVDAAWAVVDAAQWDLADAVAEAAKGAYVYAEQVFETLDDLVAFLLDQVDPPQAAGRLVLDWNAQCLHVYNNVIDDLRVNQNNARTGYATGGLLEDNRIHTIGQIRHYDGIFRQNEVGDREVLEAFVDPERDPVSSVRVMNGDGFNEGEYYDNLFYGRVELDLHGHHHGAGFFSPESHYHGSDEGSVYMKNPDGSYMTFGDAYGDMEHMDGHAHHADDRLPHHDHSKRWTSVTFRDNIIIDPAGAGLRYEDRNHEGDDRTANSEDVEELNMPHFHQTWIGLRDNTVVGSVWVDVFNADGVDLWTDDYSEVERQPVTGEIIDGLLHMGAEMVNSHHSRNDGWLDIVGNNVYTWDKPMGTLGAHDGWSAIQVNHAKELTRAQVRNNQAILLPAEFNPYMDADAFITFLEESDLRDPTDTAAVTAQMGSHNAAGPATTGILLRHVSDSVIDVCGNFVASFDRGLVATQRIYEDVSLLTCPTNNWNAADPAVLVRFTPIQEQEELATQPLRDVTDETAARNVVNPVYDELDTRL